VAREDISPETVADDAVAEVEAEVDEDLIREAIRDVAIHEATHEIDTPGIAIREAIVIHDRQEIDTAVIAETETETADIETVVPGLDRLDDPKSVTVKADHGRDHADLKQTIT